VPYKRYTDFAELLEGQDVVIAVLSPPKSTNPGVGIWMACGPSEVCTDYEKWAKDSPTEEFFPRVDIWGQLEQ
jgi:hypothetical protein